jgi:hypothetical protein
VSGGKYPTVVKALAYPNTTTTPMQSGMGTPPANAVQGTLSGDGSTWSFSLVPGAAAPESTLGTGDNSTLIVWFDYGDGTWPQNLYTAFHTYRPPSGGFGSWEESSEGGEPGLLHATFTGSLASLGTLHLTREGGKWAGEPTAGGGCTLAFFCVNGVYYLVSTGPGIHFVVSGTPSSLAPFCWSATGAAIGACAGTFGVTLTE